MTPTVTVRVNAMPAPPPVTVEITSSQPAGELLLDISPGTEPGCSHISAVITKGGVVKDSMRGEVAITYTPVARGMEVCTFTMYTLVGVPNGTFEVQATAVAPVITTSPAASATLPDTRVNGGMQTLNVQITNTGDMNQDLTVSTIAFANGTDFTVTVPGGIPSTLGMGASFNATVTFNPTMSGLRQDTLTIMSNDPSTPMKTLEFSGTGNNALISTGDATFAMTQAGMTSTANISVLNIGATPQDQLQLFSATITQSSTWFSFDTNGASSCAGLTTCSFVGVFADTNIAVRCSPPAGASGTQTAMVSINSNSDPGGDNLAMLSCNSGRPDIMVAPLALAFSDQQVTTTSPAMAFMISNVGSAPLMYDVAAATGPFARSAMCTSNCTLPAGMSAMVSVTFSPSTTGPASGSVVITSNDADVADRTKTVALTGTGTAPQISVPATLDFMTVEVGANRTLTLTAMNTGTAPLDITSAALVMGGSPAFTVTSGMAGMQQVATGGSASWMIRCTPTTSGAVMGTFRIVSNSFTGATTNVALTCSGQQGLLATTPATTAGAPLDFGGVTVGTTATQTFTLRNPGNVAVTGITGVLAPTTAGYSIDPTTPIPTMLAPGGSAMIQVLFSPQVGTDGGPATIMFSGTWGTSRTAMVTLFITGDGLTAGYDVTTIPSSSPPAIDFGSFRWDGTAIGRFCIVNTEQAPITIQNPITITPTAPTTSGELSVTAVRRNATCSATGGTAATLPQTLNQNEVLVITVTADPADRTGLLGGTVTVTSNLAMNPTRTVALTGMATSPMITTAPGMLVDFGSVDRDGPPAMRTITITNTGDGPMDLSSFARNPMTGPFTFTLPTNQTVAPNGTVDIEVTYTPTTEQAPNQFEQVIISHDIAGILNGPASQMITVRGRGIDRHIALGDAPTFPDTFRNPGAAAPVRTVTVSNTGEAPLSITALMLTNDDVWQLVDDSAFTVPPGGSHDVMVRFVPKVAGKAPQGQLTFMNNDNSTPAPMAVVLLDGNGIDRNVMMGDPEIQLGQAAIGIPITLPDALTVTSMDPANGFTIRSITLDDDSVFTIEQSPVDVTLPANSTMTFSVTFTPTTEGVFETRAHLFLDEDPTAQADVILKGQGVFVEVSGGGGCSAGGGGAGGAMALLVGLLVLRRRSAASRALLVVAVLLAVPAVGRAQPSFDLDLSLFNPTPATTGNGFQVQPASVGDNGQFAAAATVSYATNPLVLQFAGSEHMAITQRTMIELGAAYAFLGRFEAGVRMPLYNQTGDGTMVGVESPSGTARGDLVAHVKAQLAKVNSGGGALFAGAALAVTVPTATREEFAGVDGPTGRLLGLVSFTPAAMSARLTLTANAGAVIRKTETLSNIEQGSGAAWGVGVSYRALDALWVTGEAFGEVLPGARKDSPMGGGGMLTPTEALLGIQYRAGGSFNVGVAVGRGVVAGIGTPDLRGVFALSFVPGTEEPAPIKPPPPPRVEKDTDNDGILDDADRCITEAEDKDLFDDTDGCPDPDNDGDSFADAQDKCPLDAEDKDGFEDEDGCPEKDNDADGIADTADKCPMEPEDKDGTQDIDGCPDLDNDGDGLPDAQDACPNEEEVINGNTDDDGCPDRGDALVIVTPSSLDMMEGIQFTGTQVSKASTNLVNQIGATLRAHAEIVRIKIVIHVQPSKDAAKDQERSEKRAAAVRDALVQFGISANRISAVGLGGTKPLVPKNAKNAALLNDRMELIILERK